MNISVIEEKENVLLKRKDMIIDVNYENSSTPSKAVLQAAVSKQMHANIEHIEVSKIISDFGKPKGKAWIKIWKEKKIGIHGLKKEAPAEEKKA